MAMRSHRFQRISRQPMQSWRSGRSALSRAAEPSRISPTQIVVLAVVGIGLAALVYFGADLIRYMQMRRM